MERTKKPRLLCATFVAFVALVPIFATSHAQIVSEGVTSILNSEVPPTPPTDNQCTQLSWPLSGACDKGYLMKLVSGDSRCVPKCGAGEKMYDISCPSNKSDPACPDCQRGCSTCAFKKVEFENAGSNFDGGTRAVYDNLFSLTSDAPTCLGDIKSDEQKTWQKKHLKLTGASDLKYLDDYVTSSILSNFKGIIGEMNYNTVSRTLFCQKKPLYDNQINTTYPPKFLKCTYRCPVGSSRCQTGSNGVVYSPWCHNYEGKCAEGYFFVNKDCKTVQVSSSEESACNATVAAKISYVASSPISLVWQGSDRDVLKKASLVRFPLDLSNSDRWYAWYGSKEAPLLVYDPSHKGEITSAQQLFGNWTFGGQRSALVKSSEALSDAGVASKPWRNGYEALETLNHNRDGEISGAELAPLALWFDENRDGVSQQGEVTSVQEKGVKKLFLGPTITDSSDRSVRVVRGFTRISTNGSEISGATVDWYSEGGTSVSELSAKLDFARRTDASNAEQTFSDGDISRRLPWATGELVSDSPLNGRWAWSDPRDKNARERGELVLAEKAGGGISGMALSEVNLDSELPMQSAIAFKILNGEIIKRKGSKIELKFHSIDARGAQGSDPGLRTTAIFDTAAGTLSGTTTQIVGSGSTEKEVRYSWVGRKKSSSANVAK
jgi:hypothetical protein